MSLDMDLTVSPIGTVIGDMDLSGDKGISQEGNSFAPLIDRTDLRGICYANRPAEEPPAGHGCGLRRDHTKGRMQAAELSKDCPAQTVRVTGRQVPQCLDIGLPGDISRGAFWMALAAPQVGSRMILRHIDLNPARLSFVDTLLRMGVAIREEVIFCDGKDWFGNLDIRGRSLRPIQIAPKDIPLLVDEIPLLAVLAGKAKGVSSIRGASALRTKKNDGIAAIVTNLKKMDVRVEEFSDGLAICGTGHLRGAELDSFGDHRIAMAFAIAGLLAEENMTVIRNAECLVMSYPDFQPGLLKLMDRSSCVLGA